MVAQGDAPNHTVGDIAVQPCDSSEEQRRWIVTVGRHGEIAGIEGSRLVPHENLGLMPVSEHENLRVDFEDLCDEIKHLREAVRAFLEHADAPTVGEEWEFLDLEPLRDALAAPGQDDLERGVRPQPGETVHGGGGEGTVAPDPESGVPLNHPAAGQKQGDTDG